MLSDEKKISKSGLSKEVGQQAEFFRAHSEVEALVMKYGKLRTMLPKPLST